MNNSDKFLKILILGPKTPNLLHFGHNKIFLQNMGLVTYWILASNQTRENGATNEGRTDAQTELNSKDPPEKPEVEFNNNLWSSV